MPEVERIGDDWADQTGHCARYRWAADRTYPGEIVNDIACGIGYGSTFFIPTVEYHGYDRPDVPVFRGTFHACDLNSTNWFPDACDVTVCFETLEHVEDPKSLAWLISYTTRRAIFVSVPTVPTADHNQYHLHDFTVDDIPPMFPDFRIVERWAQPEELSHVWHFER